MRAQCFDRSRVGVPSRHSFVPGPRPQVWAGCETARRDGARKLLTAAPWAGSSLSSECRHLSPHLHGTSAPSWRSQSLATPEPCHPPASAASYFQWKTSLTKGHWTRENCLELEPCCPLRLMSPLPRGPQSLVRKVLAPAIKSLCSAAPNSGPSFLEPLKLFLRLPNTDAARKKSPPQRAAAAVSV